MKLAICLLLVCAVTAWLPAACIIGTPDLPASQVDAAGALLEDWGRVELQLTSPAGAAVTGQECTADRGPVVVTTTTAGEVTLTQTAYRAPIWPAGVDVVEARLVNGGAAAAKVGLRVALPAGAGVGEETVLLGGRVILGFPSAGSVAPVREERQWGCTGGVVPMPGWARPNRACDPAFNNISAGMGGVPIVYRFGVSPRGRRTVVLGFCESHHGQMGARPLVIRVEGAPEMTIDPLALWGQHGPGVLRFDAQDTNGDGRLQLGVYPKRGAADVNPILNVIWLFPADRGVDLDRCLAGELSKEAEYYVDVGGEKDGLVYVGGKLEYALELPAGGSQELTFLVASPGGNVPNPQVTPWPVAALRRAAADVWAGWWAKGKVPANLSADQLTRYRLALAQLAMLRVQANGFEVPIADVGAAPEPNAELLFAVAAAFDAAGLHREAERLLRVAWERPAPEPLAAWAGIAEACRPALARHAAVTGDTAWAKLAGVQPAEADVPAAPGRAGAAARTVLELAQ